MILNKYFSNIFIFKMKLWNQNIVLISSQGLLELDLYGFCFNISFKRKIQFFFKNWRFYFLVPLNKL
jgi:hypothetical protein